jgi:hypothetical protein
MRAFPSLVALAVIVAMSTPRPAAATWPTNGRAIVTATTTQVHPAIATDGAGGAVITWQDFRLARVNVFAAHVLASGERDVLWPVDGRALLNDPAALATAAGGQTSPAVVSDGAGGAIVAWQDLRDAATDLDIFAQHILASGQIDPRWPANGTALVALAANQDRFVMVPDDAGGAFVAWRDARAGVAQTDIFAQHVLSSGVVDPRWPANGLVVCGASGAQDFPAIVADGTGGAIATWDDPRAGSLGLDVYAQRVLASGVSAPGWPLNGSAVCTSVGDQGRATITTDGAQGAIIAWADNRVAVGTNHVFAQHVSGSGTVDPLWPVDGRRLSDAGVIEGRAIAVSDGEGGAVVSWQAFTVHINQFAQHIRGNGVLDPAWPAGGKALALSDRDQTFAQMVSDGTGGAVVAWEEAADVIAQHVLISGDLDPSYPTAGRALVQLPSGQGDVALVAAGSGGAIGTWSDGRDGNIDVYAMQVLFATPVSVPPPAPVVDALTFERPPSITGRDPLTLRFILPHDADVRLAVFDASGSRVRELASGVRTAGEHSVDWDRRDQTGNRVLAGLYFAQLVSEGQSITHKIATLQ